MFLIKEPNFDLYSSHAVCLQHLCLCSSPLSFLCPTEYLGFLFFLCPLGFLCLLQTVLILFHGYNDRQNERKCALHHFHVGLVIFRFHNCPMQP